MPPVRFSCPSRAPMAAIFCPALGPLISCSTRSRLLRVLVEELLVRLALLKRVIRSPLVMPFCRARVDPPAALVTDPGDAVEPRAVSLAMIRVPALTLVRPTYVLAPERTWVNEFH